MGDRFTVARRRRELRERAVAFLGGECVICHYKGCAAAFDFHHPSPLEKDFTISDRMTSWAAIEREVKKCILLCARCHREVHDGLHPRYLEDESANRGLWDEGLSDEGLSDDDLDATDLAPPPWPVDQPEAERIEHFS